MRRVAAALAMAALFAAPLGAASLVDPARRFRTVRTDHFVIYFHQGEDATAARLAAIAEETWQKLQRPLGVTPPPRTHVILVDQTELSNGFATPVPYDTVFITAVWPAGSDFIGNTDDWLRVAFTHEFTHIVHLDRSEGWARALRGVFGRVSYAFPNLYLPTWQIEGLATYEESVITGEGRLHAGDFRSVVTEAARQHALEPLDRVNGGLTDWPGGNAAYAYGLGFHAYLADTYGADKFSVLADATARRVPYTASRVFKRVYGKSLGDLWAEYERSLEQAVPPSVAPADAPVRVTHHGFTVNGPRFASSSCSTCPPAIVYSVRTPHEFPTLNRVALDGSDQQVLARRYLGSTSAITRDTIYFDQLEVRRNVGLYSDLYALDRATGHVRQLTSEARLIDPDVSPDGTMLVCAQEAPGRRDLVLVRLEPDATDHGVEAARRVMSGFSRTETLVSEPELQFNAPRWSPDGRSIAVERHRPGRLPEIVIVDVATRQTQVVASSDRARVVTPTWRPDGLAVIAAAAVEDGPFNLYEFSLAGGAARQLTHVTGGATWPDVSPDGRTIAFAGYTSDGFDVFTVPYPATAIATGEPFPATTAGPPVAGDVRAAAVLPLPPAHSYSPWPTLAPTSWTPVVTTDNNSIRVGAGVSGYDALQYHAYAVSATWLVSAPMDAQTPSAALPDWQASYAYTRWRLVPFASASVQTSFFAGPPTATGLATSATLREQQVEAGVLLPILHAWTSHTAFGSLVRIVDDYTLPTRTVSLNRTAARVAWASSDAHTYEYSISPEAGVTLGGTAQLVRSALGASADATTLTGDARLYLPGVAPHHVVAIRVAGGSSTGNINVRDTFLLGGAGPDLSTTDFNRSAIGLLRGFAADSFAGTHVGLINADYRFPLGRPQRGLGTWPVFLHTIHAAVFGDAGHAWTGTFRSSDLKTSVGGELSANIVAGYFFPFTVTAGVGRGHDGSGALSDGTTFYLRVGHAF